MNCQREKFNLQRKVAYLNCAYMSPLLRKVEKAGIAGIKQKRKPFHLSPEDFFTDADTLRLLFSQLINVKDKNRCVIIPSVSYGMANVAKNLKASKGDNIVVAGEQFPSNMYPWMELRGRGVELNLIAPPAGSMSRGATWNQNILEAINSKTKLVSLGHIHWADGTLFDLQAIRKRSREVGALLVIDGTQSIGALPFDVEEIAPDAVIVAGYKWLMGPYSIGMAYYGEAFDQGSPLEENWINRKESENFDDLINYKDQYQPAALRYEVGEHSNFILVPMMIAGLKQLLKWKPENIQAYCKTLTDPYLDQIQAHGGHIEDEAFRTSHMIGIRYDELDTVKAKKIFKANKVSVSFRGQSIRISPNVYNDQRDMDKLMTALKQLH